MKSVRDSPMTVHYVLKEKDGIYVGHCVEIPAIVAYGKTQKEVETEIQKAITSYFIAFPEQRNAIRREEVREIEVKV